MERGISSPVEPDDDALVGDLRRIFSTIDPVPEQVQIAACAALDWRTIDAELAALVQDSQADEPALALRGPGEPRALMFQAPDLLIEVEAETLDGGEALRIVGQLVPPQSADVALYHGDELIATRADDRGRFAAGGIARGEISLRCRLDGPAGSGRLVETAWLSI